MFVASQTELDLGGLLVGAVRWRRLEGRYLPGAGETAQGYLLSDEHADSGPGEEAEVLERELQALWDDPRADASAVAGALVAASDCDTADALSWTPAAARAEQRKGEVMIVKRTARRAGRGAAGGGRAVGGRGDRPDRADRHQRGRAGADLQGHAA